MFSFNSYCRASGIRCIVRYKVSFLLQPLRLACFLGEQGLVLSYPSSRMDEQWITGVVRTADEEATGFSTTDG